MSLWMKDGKLVSSGGSLVNCDDCPCEGGTVEIDCCPEPVPTTLFASLYFVADDLTFDCVLTYDTESPSDPRWIVGPGIPGEGWYGISDDCEEDSYMLVTFACDSESDTWGWQIEFIKGGSSGFGTMGDSGEDVEVTCDPFAYQYTGSPSFGVLGVPWCGVTASPPQAIVLTVTA